LKFVKPAVLLAALLLAACQSTPPPAPVAQVPAAAGRTHGIDLATDSSDVLGQLRGFPVNFVARYYRDPASRWPALTPSEAQRLSAAGLNIVTVWEWRSNNPSYFSYATGYNDALSAQRQAKAVGQPPGSAIYFAVDFNARGAQLYQVDQYFRGIAAGLAAAGGGRPEYKVGVYGSGAVCGAVRAAGLAQYAWLSGSAAWEGTAGYSGWNIKQAAAGARFANLSFSHDANEARDDYGGFQLAGYGNPATAAIAVAAAAPAAAAAIVNTAVAAAVPAPASAPPPAPALAAPPTRVVVATPRAPAPAPMITADLEPPPPAAKPSAPARAVPSEPGSPRPRHAEPDTVRQPKPDSAFAAAVMRAAAAMAPSRAYAAELHPARDNPHKAKPSTRAASAHERAAPHAAKAVAGSKRTVYAAATTKSTAAASPRKSGGASHGELHERGHRVSAPRRAQDHGARVQAGRNRTVSVLH
jgi:glycoside hydrolase-like protein